MKYSLLAAMLLASASSLMAQESIQQGNISQDHTFENVVGSKGIHLGKGWVVNIDERLGWVQYDYHNPPPGNSNINKGHTDSKGIYLVSKGSVTTPTLAGFAAKVTGIYTTDFGINDPAYETRTFVPNPGDPKSFGILQEAFIRFDMNHNKALIGRQELTTPMIDADDWYMQANAFEVAHYTNTMLENNTFALGYFFKMAGVWDSGAYDPVIAPRGGTDFYSMSQASFVGAVDKKNADDAGVIFGAYELSLDHHSVQVWEYYATDLYNTLFAQYDYKGSIGSFSYVAGAQYINFKEVGKLADNAKKDRALGSAGRTIDASMYSARFDGSFDFGLNFATGATKYSAGDGFGSVLGAWGGYPYFANGMIFHFFEAGTLKNAASYKVQIGYDLMEKLWLGYRLTYFDLDPAYSKSSVNAKGQDSMTLNGVRLSYGGSTGTYFTGTYEHQTLSEQPNTFSLRLIGGYRF